MKRIKKLSENLIQQIAAGEIVERPVNVIKELVENSLDAGAKNITLKIQQGGKALIDCRDDGNGIHPDDLAMTIQRHATSKLHSGDLFAIDNFGFRGEALSAVASVSRFTITTSYEGRGYQLKTRYGSDALIKPAAHNIGTRLQVEDLLGNLPARRKFLRSDRAEAQYCGEMFKSMALANPKVNFSFYNNDKIKFECKTPEFDESNQSENNEKNLVYQRAKALIGEEFYQNALWLDSGELVSDEEGEKLNDKIKLHGCVGVPTLNRGDLRQQYFFVNNRVLNDKTISGLMRAAYGDSIPKGRYPCFLIYMDIPAYLVDVNVHPAKTEVRFRKEQLIRSYIIREIRRILRNAEPQTSDQLSIATLKAFSHTNINNTQSRNKFATSVSGVGSKINRNSSYSAKPSLAQFAKFAEPSASFLDHNIKTSYISSNDAQSEVNELDANFAHITNNDQYQDSSAEIITNNHDSNQDNYQELNFNNDYPLGFAIGQVGKCYIVAKSSQGVVLVDQHAAHERIIYEQLKQNANAHSDQQNLLVPIIVELDVISVDNLLLIQHRLEQQGLVFESFGKQSIAVRAVPAILSQSNITELIKLLASEDHLFWEQFSHDTHQSKDYNKTAFAEDSLASAILHKLATAACHHSIRGGRELTIAQMNQLLRQIEETPLADQCNHGRPTHLTLSLKDIEKIFGRT